MANYKAKSAILSRKPYKKKEGIWSVLIALFDENNAHLKGKDPVKVLEYKAVSEVLMKEMEGVSFFPAGNDVVINDLSEVGVGKKGNIVTLNGIKK